MNDIGRDESQPGDRWDDGQGERSGGDGLDPWLRDVARAEYNPPPEPPRDAMWRDIETEWRGRRQRRSGPNAWRRWGVGLAAVLAIGIGIGRLSVPGTAPGDGVATPASEDSGPVGGGALVHGETPYGLVVAQALSQAEVLLTAFAADTRRPESVDAETVAWARDVLTTTRLLMDSPPADDPRLRTLLEDLELTLVQMVQRSGGDESGSAEWIRQAIRERDILSRLRTAVPPGVVAAAM